jgi:Immunoglobulin domain
MKLTLGFLLLVVWTSRVAAQSCSAPFLTGEPAQGFVGTNLPIEGVTTWDPDGSGPQPDLLVAVGSFHFTGNLEQLSIGVWNGTNWISIASPAWGGSASAVVVHDQKLIVAGSFSSSGNPVGKVVQFDGVNWSTIAAQGASRISDMAVWNGQLYVSGTFSSVNGVACANIAKWDGTSWQPLGSGIVQSTGDTQVVALTVHDGALYAGGRFDTAGGAPALGLARWDGSSWSAVGGGTFGVAALASFQGSLFVGGERLAVAGGSTGNLLRWNGSAWSTINPSMEISVRSLDATATRLYSGMSVGGPAGVLSFDGTTLSSLGPGSFRGGEVRALTLFRGGVVAAGSFASMGNRGVQNIARFTTAWQPLGTGIENSLTRTAIINSAVEDAEYLYVGGHFTGIGGQLAANIARKNAAGQWSPLGTPGGGVTKLMWWDPDGTGPLGLQLTAALEHEPGSQFFAGVRRWDGSAWVNVMPAIGLVGAPSIGARVTDLLIFEGELVACGNFDRIDGVPTSQVVRLRGGVWESMGQPFHPRFGNSAATVSSLAIHNGSLYAVGTFAVVGSSSSFTDFVRWTGTTWEQETPVPVYLPSSVASYQGRLFLLSSNKLSSWDGMTWTDYPASTPSGDGARSLVIVDGELLAPPFRFTGRGMQTIAGVPSQVNSAIRLRNGNMLIFGEFTFLNNLEPARCLAEFQRTVDVPRIATQPNAVTTVCLDDELELAVVLSNPLNKTYRWQRNGVDLVDGRGIGGSQTSRLTIRDVYPEDAGTYQCVVQSVCAGTVSFVATVNIDPAICTSRCDDVDFNNNGVFPEDADILDFFTVLAGGSCP